MVIICSDVAASSALTLVTGTVVTWGWLAWPPVKLGGGGRMAAVAIP